MKTYSYQAPLSKSSTKQLIVMDSDELKVGYIERYFNSIFHRFFDMWVGENKFLSKHRAFDENGNILIEAIKRNYLMKRSDFTIRFISGKSKAQELLVQQIGMEIINPVYEISGENVKISVEKGILNWVKFYENNHEIARWKISLKDKMNAQIEIEEKATIQDPLFYAIVGQLLYFVGD